MLDRKWSFDESWKCLCCFTDKPYQCGFGVVKEKKKTLDGLGWVSPNGLLTLFMFIGFAIKIIFKFCKEYKCYIINIT